MSGSSSRVSFYLDSLYRFSPFRNLLSRDLLSHNSRFRDSLLLDSHFGHFPRLLPGLLFIEIPILVIHFLGIPFFGVLVLGLLSAEFCSRNALLRIPFLIISSPDILFL